MNYLFKMPFFALLSFNLLGAQSTINIPAKTTTTPTGNDVDDCAIWVHPTDPSKSLVIINDKGPATDKSGLYVYDLSGTELQKVSVHQPQNPDIRYNVIFGSDTMDVLVCVDREAGNSTYNKVRVYKINPEKAQSTSGFLTEITTSQGIPTGQSEAYGHSLYQRPSDGALFSIVSPYSKANFTQIKLESDGAGKVKGGIVRKWGSSDIGGDICEGICADDELGFIYICDENTQVLKYYADPDKNVNSPVAKFAQDDGIAADREGINIYRCDDTTGSVLLSSQGNDQIKVYDRITNAFMGTVIPQGMKDCDGLDVTAMPLGAKFPHGMAAIHLGTMAGSQYSFYDWSDIATGLSLAKPCDAQRPSRPKGVPLRDPKTASRAHFLRFSHLLYLRNIALLQIPSFIKGSVKIVLYDLKGKMVGTLYDGFIIRSGEISISFNTSNVRAGAYLVKLSANNATLVQEAIMLK